MVTIAITYDNNAYDSRFRPAWGFSCFVRLPEANILFDTGGDGSILLSNMEKLGVQQKEIAKGRVHLVVGGFHFSGASSPTIGGIIEDFIELGVEKVAPCHCSGDRARMLLQKHFGQNYVRAGVGERIDILE